MGEAKTRKKHNTLDGGPITRDKIALELHTFSLGPDVIANGGRHALAAMREVYLWVHRRPPPVCGACDYEFKFGERPPLAYYTRPAFPKANGYTSIVGAICGRCARLPHESLIQALVEHLRQLKPDIEVLRPQ